MLQNDEENGDDKKPEAENGVQEKAPQTGAGNDATEQKAEDGKAGAPDPMDLPPHGTEVCCLELCTVWVHCMLLVTQPRGAIMPPQSWSTLCSFVLQRM